jgi:hypothetical protein
MDSFASKSSVTQRLGCVAVWLTIGAFSGCASDDSDESDDSQAASADTSSDEAKSGDAKEEDEEVKELTPEERARIDEETNPGSSSVTRFDGNWSGTTSQDQPVKLKVLNRFLAHVELGYKLDGDGCDAAESLVKLSAMQGTRMGAFTLMWTTEEAKLTMTGKFPADSESEGEFTIEAVGDVPEGCNPSVSGTWKATK